MTSSVSRPLETHGNKREDGRSKEGEVGEVGGLAEPVTEVPHAEDVVVGLEGNAHDADEKVGERQTHDKQVRHADWSKHHQHSNDDEHVSCT